MLALIVLVIFGLGMAYFATQNTLPISFTIGNYRFTNVPLYILAIGSLLLGIFISWIVSVMDDLSPSKGIDKTDKTIEELKEEKQELEVENARLKEKEEAQRPSLIHRLKHSFS